MAGKKHPSPRRAPQAVEISERFIVYPLSLTVVVVVLYFVWVLGFFELDWKSPTAQSLFDPSGESSVATWLSGSMLLVSAVIAGVLAFRASAPARMRWTVLAGALLLFSIDEVAALHEVLSANLSNRTDTHGVLRYPWVIPGAIAAAALAWVLVPFMLQLPRRVGRLLLAGFVLFIGAALGLELLEGWLDSRYDSLSLGNTLARGTQEITEMVGVLFFLWGLLRAAGRLQLSVDAPNDEP